MMTLNRAEIEIGREIGFAELWDGEGDGDELLKSGSIAVYDNETESENIVAFEVIEPNDELLKTVVRITDLY